MNFTQTAEDYDERALELEQLLNRKDEEIVCLKEETKDLLATVLFLEKKLEIQQNVLDFWNASATDSTCSQTST